uniref:Uncharacterized protein n=1 Tax=Musca domestica TaxID=7370 RepID=A0A1I8MEU0_MUSDO
CHSSTTVIIKKIECKIIDPDFVDFPVCEVMANGKKSSVSVTAHIRQLPVSSVSLNVVLQPLYGKNLAMLNATWDACAFMKNRKRNRALNRLFKYLAPYTNVNHSCPYNHDIIVRNFTLWNQTPLFSSPNVAFKISIGVYAGDKYRALLVGRADLEN